MGENPKDFPVWFLCKAWHYNTNNINESQVFCVFIIMEIQEIMIASVGVLVSVIAFYLKRESSKIQRLGSKIRRIEVDLAKNGARDSERWEQTQRLLEDRRKDVVRIFEKLDK